MLLRHLQRTVSWPLWMTDRMPPFPNNAECNKLLFHVQITDIITTESTPFLKQYATSSDTMNRVWLSELNRSKPRGYSMYHQFNIHKFYVLPTQCICVLYSWEQIAIVSLYSINRLVLYSDGLFTARYELNLYIIQANFSLFWPPPPFSSRPSSLLPPPPRSFSLFQSLLRTGTRLHNSNSPLLNVLSCFQAIFARRTCRGIASELGNLQNSKFSVYLVQ